MRIDGRSPYIKPIAYEPPEIPPLPVGTPNVRNARKSSKWIRLGTASFVGGLLAAVGSALIYRFGPPHDREAPPPAAGKTRSLLVRKSYAPAELPPPPDAGADPSAPAPDAHASRITPAPLPLAVHPLTVADVRTALRVGLSEDEIIAMAAHKDLVETVGAPEAAELRSLGAGPKLIAFLQSRKLFAPVPSCHPADADLSTRRGP